jgi:predicted AlkP superfamily phosphohydrolase/phosphomutase
LGGFLVGAVSDEKRLENILCIYKNMKWTGGDKIATKHLKDWAEAHGFTLTSDNAKQFSEKVLEARKKEIEGLLNKVAETKQRIEDEKNERVGAKYIAQDNEERERQRII